MRAMPQRGYDEHMDIRILELIEGAKRAEGLTVIIDVFRAFSLECYLYARGAKEILPVGDINRAFALKREDESRVLIGERGGKKCEGCDFGNSPSQTEGFDFTGRTVVHTTSAGTQGVAGAVNASEIITGSLVNARAIASYIRMRAPEVVSLVAMGTDGVRPAQEDLLCAEYIRGLLGGGEMPDMPARIAKLRAEDGSKFFVKETQEIFPERDFAMCVDVDRFPFVLRIERDGAGRAVSRRIDLA